MKNSPEIYSLLFKAADGLAPLSFGRSSGKALGFVGGYLQSKVVRTLKAEGWSPYSMVRYDSSSR